MPTFLQLTFLLILITEFILICKEICIIFCFIKIKNQNVKKRWYQNTLSIQGWERKNWPWYSVLTQGNHDLTQQMAKYQVLRV